MIRKIYPIALGLSMITAVYAYAATGWKHSQHSMFCGNSLYRDRYQNCATMGNKIYMGMKINIRIVGRKSSEPWLEDGVDMYEKRLRPSNVEVDTTWHKDNAALMKGIDMDRSKNHKVICLDVVFALFEPCF